MAFEYNNLKQGYIDLWNTMTILPAKEALANEQAALAKKYKYKYDEVNEALRKIAPASRIPWYVIALIHRMECVHPYEFANHLHNGDPLRARTVQVPKGRPVKGNAPFTFVQSAVDALIYQGLTGEIDWSIPKMLYRFEGFNGYGYRGHGVNSPYLWAGSNHYGTEPNVGKYIADKVFKKYDSKGKPIISDQIGTAVLLKLLYS